MAPQNETHKDFPNDIIIGIRSNDEILVETRTSPGSPGIEFPNIVVTEPRGFKGTDATWRFQLFMEPATFKVFYDALTAYKAGKSSR